MKHWKLLLLGLVIVLGVAQVGPGPVTTAFSRLFLRSPDAVTAVALLELSSSSTTNLPNVTVTNTAAFLSNVTVATNLTVEHGVFSFETPTGVRMFGNPTTMVFNGNGGYEPMFTIQDDGVSLVVRVETGTDLVVAPTSDVLIYGAGDGANNMERVRISHEGAGTATPYAVFAAEEAGTGSDNQGVKIITKGTGAFMHNSGTADRLRSECGTVTLTDNTATTVATFAVATNAVYGSKVFYTIRSVGTDFAQQAETGELLITGVNVDGTITSAAVSETSIQAVSAGTLTTDWAVTASGNTILLQCDADSDLTDPTITVIATFVNSFGTITRP